MNDKFLNNQGIEGSNIQGQEYQEIPTPRNLNENMRRSRLKRSVEKRTKQQMFYMILGMLGIVGILAVFGVPLLVNYSVMVDKIRGEEDVTLSQNKDDFIAPPMLLAEFTATNSAKISLSGTAAEDHTVKLYVNDELLEKITVRDDGSFTAREIKLSDGDNEIKAKAVNREKEESGFSDIVTIFYKNEPPTLSIDSPQDNQIVSGENNTVQVTGKTDPGVKVRVNSFWAIVDSSGNYKYNLTIQNGDNRFTVEATDKAGNKTEQSRNVIYNH